MGVCVTPIELRDFEWEGEMVRGWCEVSTPLSPGYTYSHWKQILNDLCIGEVLVVHGQIPVKVLWIHLQRLCDNVEPRVLAELSTLAQFCDDNGITHIGWA